MTKRELQVRYKQSFFGISWAILQPLVMAFVFALFFGKLARIPSDGIPFPVFAIVGLVPWLFTAQAINGAANSLVLDSNLVQKVYFPRLILPIAKALGLTLDLIIALVVVLLVIAVYGVGVASTAFLVPLFLMLGVLTAFAFGTLFAAVNVKYRDVSLIVPVIVQMWLFLTPVIYPASLVTGDLKYLWAINPMVSVIDGTRWALLGTPAPEPLTVVISVVSALAVLTGAIAYFRNTELYFADIA
jgi:lipopolysaccharide transport system permease protein